jgi:hypothetical protein
MGIGDFPRRAPKQAPTIVVGGAPRVVSAPPRKDLQIGGSKRPTGISTSGSSGSGSGKGK